MHAAASVNVVEPTDKGLDRTLCFVNNLVYFLNTVFQKRGNFPRGMTAELRKITDFLGNDGESLAIFACARRFDGGVE